MNVIAQQLVDAADSEKGGGGLAFVLLVLTVVIIWGSLLFMDRIRKRAAQKTDEG